MLVLKEFFSAKKYDKINKGAIFLGIYYFHVMCFPLKMDIFSQDAPEITIELKSHIKIFIQTVAQNGFSYHLNIVPCGS